MAGAAYVQASVRVTAARIAGDMSAMDRAAGRVLTSVKGIAAQHRDTGAYIANLGVVTAPGLIGNGRLVNDRLVVADDPASAAIEWGHMVGGNAVRGSRRAQWTAETGVRMVRWVPGQHIMKRGLAAVS